MKKTDTKTLIEALRILVRDIQSDDGIANACIAEAADRIDELTQALESATQTNVILAKRLGDAAIRKDAGGASSESPSPIFHDEEGRN